MEVLGIHTLVFGKTDMSDRTILSDMGITCQGNTYTLLNGSTVRFNEYGSGLLEIHWAVTGKEKSSFVDNGITHVFDPSLKFTEVNVTPTETNSYLSKQRINKQVPIDDVTSVCGIAHIAVYSLDLQATVDKFLKNGFVITDSIKNKSVFLRSKQENPHHQILVMKSTEKQGFQHIALNVKDVYSVITKGLTISSRGHKTVLGPGRHVISSSTTWYFNTALGAIELAADEDYVTGDWEPTEYDPVDSLIYEWAIEGGLDPSSRRQTGVELQAKFIDERLK